MVWGQMAGQRAQSGIKCRMHCLVSNVTLTTGLIRGKLGVAMVSGAGSVSPAPVTLII